MMELSREQAIKEFRKMWKWIAEETIKQRKFIRKIEYFKVHNIDIMDMPIHQCYLCEFADNDCKRCPIEWEGGSCNYLHSEYNEWRYSNDYIETYDTALKISRLKEKEV